MKNRKNKTLATVALALCLLAGTATTALAADYSGPEWGPLPDSGSFSVSGSDSGTVTASPDKNTGSGNSSAVTGGAASSGNTSVMAPEEFIQAHVDRVNDYRRQAGLNEVTLDPQLTEIAQARLNENNGLLSHNRPNGDGFWTIFDEYDIAMKPTGENVAGAAASPSHVADGFYRSDGHRRNMLDEEAEYIGIGLEYVDSIGGYAVLQLFAKDA